MKTSQTFTLSSGCEVRPLQTSDVSDQYVDGLNNPLVNRFLNIALRPRQTIESVTCFVKENIDSDNSLLWGIWAENSKTHCGTVRLSGIDLDHGIANIGLCLFDMRMWGKGIGTEAVTAITTWAHSERKLRWLEAGVNIHNNGSQKVFEKSGFRCIGYCHNKYIFEGRPTSIKIYVSLKKA